MLLGALIDAVVDCPEDLFVVGRAVSEVHRRIFAGLAQLHAAPFVTGSDEHPLAFRLDRPFALDLVPP
jgi:hypothetical protein